MVLASYLSFPQKNDEKWPSQHIPVLFAIHIKDGRHQLIHWSVSVATKWWPLDEQWLHFGQVGIFVRKPNSQDIHQIQLRDLNYTLAWNNQNI